MRVNCDLPELHSRTNILKH